MSNAEDQVYPKINPNTTVGLPASHSQAITDQVCKTKVDCRNIDVHVHMDMKLLDL